MRSRPRVLCPGDWRLWQTLLLLLVLLTTVESFVIHKVSPTAVSPVSLDLSSSSSPSKEVTDVRIVSASDWEEEAIIDAASFLVDAFWLGSPRQWLDEAAGTVTSDVVKRRLVEEQAADLMKYYGERMGKRVLNSCLVFATHGDGIPLGMLGMQVLLLDSTEGNILTAEQSEAVLTNAVASLGPKQRRQYKDASAQQIAEELLPPSLEAICFFSNLAVSPNARRQGIAFQLCQEVERIAKQGEWNFDSVYLKVEIDNEAAVRLYEDKLDYVCAYTIEADPAIRLDTAAGEFIGTTEATLLLKKAL